MKKCLFTLLLFVGCQVVIIQAKEYFCEGCEVNGHGMCDEGNCPKYTFYDFTMRMCQPCQLEIGGYGGINCLYCQTNRKDRCDNNGCPVLTYYNEAEHRCEEDVLNRNCISIHILLSVF